MEVITIESQAFIELMSKVDTIANHIAEKQSASENPDDEWVDSNDVCMYLKISERTLQRLRTKGIITYSMISGKSYYTIGEIKRMLNEKRIRSTDECLTDLIHNYKLNAIQRRNTKAD